MPVKGKRILFVSETGGFSGGVERFIAQASTALRNIGVRTAGVFMRRGRDSELFLEHFDSTGWGMAALATEVTQADVIWLHKCTSLAEISRACGKTPQVLYVHDHDYTCFRRHKYYPVGRINCRWAAGPWCRVCGSLSRGHGQWGQFQENREALKRFPLLLAGSDFMLEEMAANGVERERLKRLEPLIDLRRREKARSEETARGTRFLYVGRLIRGKGVDLALQALARLPREEEWRFRIVGDGEDSDYCRDLAVRLGIEERVEFTGYTSRPEEYYADAQCAIFPSRWQEPFGMTGCEAMAQGVPVVGFDTGGVRQWLHNEQNGLLVPPRDVTAMAQALERVLRHPADAWRWGENGRKEMARYTADAFATHALALIEEGCP